MHEILQVNTRKKALALQHRSAGGIHSMCLQHLYHTNLSAKQPLNMRVKPSINVKGIEPLGRGLPCISTKSIFCMCGVTQVLVGKARVEAEEAQRKCKSCE